MKITVQVVQNKNDNWFWRLYSKPNREKLSHSQTYRGGYSACKKTAKGVAKAGGFDYEEIPNKK